jgi:hypothetical protein
MLEIQILNRWCMIKCCNIIEFVISQHKFVELKAL